MCIMAARKGVTAANSFLDDFSTALRRALNLEGLLLNPAPPGGDPCGATLWWCARFSAASPWWRIDLSSVDPCNVSSIASAASSQGLAWVEHDRTTPPARRSSCLPARG